MKYRFLLAGVMLFISCNKEQVNTTKIQGNTTVTGKVMDKTTGLGLPGIPVMIWGCAIPSCCTPGAVNCSFVDTAFTDNSGNYSISFDSTVNTGYAAVTTGNSVFKNDSINYIRITAAQTGGVNFILSPLKIVQVNLKIVNAAKNSFYSNYATTKSNFFPGSYLIQRSTAIANFDTTLNLKALALSKFTFFTESCNFNAGSYSNCSFSIDTVFNIQNVDTTKLSLLLH